MDGLLVLVSHDLKVHSIAFEKLGRCVRDDVTAGRHAMIRLSGLSKNVDGAETILAGRKPN
jgi:hypothetical protein